MNHVASGTVLLSTFPNEPAAQIARAILDANDIPSIISTDGASGLEPQLLFVTGVRLLVRAEDADDARALLESADEPESRDA